MPSYYALDYEENTEYTNGKMGNYVERVILRVKHRPGERMTHEDATSRAPVDEAADTMNELIKDYLEVLTVSTEQDEVVAMQHSDPKLAELITILKLSPEKRTTEH